MFSRNFLVFFAFALGVATVCFALSSVYFWRWLNTPIFIPEESRAYAVESGENLHRISRKLHERELLAWPKVWIVYARLSGAPHVNVGEFLLADEESPISLLRKFQSNNYIQYQLVIVEGSTFTQLVGQLDTATKLSHEIQRPIDPAKTQLPGVKEHHLEGLFFADTYFYSAGESDLSILMRAYRKLHSVLEQEWQNRDEGLPYSSPYEALILASIIEKETGAPHERAEIAGVFVRRLEKGMRLQTDPTVIYGLQRPWDGNLTRTDLRSKHPYNTYVNHGLPPSPIALVGREAIHAALHPLEGTSLYFVAKGDGTHQFSDTFEEHRLAVEQYQLKRKNNYRSRYENKTQQVSE